MKTGTKILIGVALAGAVGYLLWKRSQNKKSTGAANTAVGGVPKGSATGVIIDPKMVEIRSQIKGQANTGGSTRGGGVRESIPTEVSMTEVQTRNTPRQKVGGAELIDAMIQEGVA